MSMRYREDSRPPMRVTIMALALVGAAAAGAALGFVWPDDEDEDAAEVQEPESAAVSGESGSD